MRITVLGSSAMFSTTERACSGYLMDFDGTTIWLDAGGGTWRNLIERFDYRKLDGILLTHRHPDHTIDVFQAFHARHYGGPEPLESIPLWAPQETIDAVVGYSEPVAKSFEMRSISEREPIEVGSARFVFTRMAHPPETMGIRVECPEGVLAYSSDTGPDADFARLARDADLFVCESTFQDSDTMWEGHMSATQAGSAAARAGVRRLLLTHLPAGRDLSHSIDQARRQAGEVDIALAVDGLTMEVGR